MIILIPNLEPIKQNNFMLKYEQNLIYFSFFRTWFNFRGLPTSNSQNASSTILGRIIFLYAFVFRSKFTGNIILIYLKILLSANVILYSLVYINIKQLKK